MNVYNTQQLLFDKTQPIVVSQGQAGGMPEEFYTQGYVVLDDITSADEARKQIESMLGMLDTSKLPFHSHILDQIQLAKADIIPVCDDSVDTSFQALHFDMGQPLVSAEPQTMYTMIGLYLPLDKTNATAKTRVLSLSGLLKESRWGGRVAVEEKIKKYIEKHGDGWDDINTGRISCFARIIDAVSGTEELADYRDKTMAEWFKTEGKDGFVSMRNEHAFYKLRNVDVPAHEKQITLQPGQLLLMDNLRVAHGRIGKREAQEVYQLMYGVQSVSPEVITEYRQYLAELLTEQKADS